MTTSDIDNARAAAEPVKPVVSLAEAIKSYWDGVSALAALPDEAVTTETEDSLYDDLVHQHARRLIDWPTPAQSMDEALAALDTVAKDMEDFSGNRLAGAMFNAALSYLRDKVGAQ